MQQNVLSWPKTLFGFFTRSYGRNPHEVFGQCNIKEFTDWKANKYFIMLLFIINNTFQIANCNYHQYKQLV